MTQIKEESGDIPSLDDFTESSLLDQIKEPGEEETETDEEKVAREAEEAKLEEEKLAEEEEEETPEEEAARLAKEQEEEELTEEEKEALAKKKEEEEANEGSFWEDVEAITGNSYEVEYGDTDPDSPEGAAIREKAVSDKAIQDNLAYLEESFPEGFKALMHVSNGGKVEDLINPTGVDYLKVDVKEENVGEQKSFMKAYYIEKGFSEAKALRNVEDDEDSEEGLFKNFSAALKEKQDQQSASTDAAFKKQEQVKQAEEAQDRKFGENLSGIISKGQIGNFKIAKKDAENYYNYVLNHVERKNGGYSLSIPLTNENFHDQLQQMFFGFQKGDLSKFVATKAKTENTRKLKRSMGKEKTKPEEHSEDGKRKRGKALPTLGDFGAE